MPVTESLKRLFEIDQSTRPNFYFWERCPQILTPLHASIMKKMQTPYRAFPLRLLFNPFAAI
jgi:hypothetical protein